MDKRKYVFFIGRWNPFHNGHKYIIDSFVNNGKDVAIGVRDTDEEYTADQRVDMISSCYKKQIESGQVKVFVMPDIETVAVGRSVGYSIMEVPEQIKTISATNIRAGVSNDLPKSVKDRMEYYDAK